MKTWEDNVREIAKRIEKQQNGITSSKKEVPDCQVTMTSNQVKQIIMCLQNAVYKEKYLDESGDKATLSASVLSDTGRELNRKLCNDIGMNPEEEYIDILTLKKMKF